MISDINQLYLCTFCLFLASGPMIETMSQWKALIAFGDSTLATAICYCLNFQQGMNKDENSKPRLLSPKDIAGETKIYHYLFAN